MPDRENVERLADLLRLVAMSVGILEKQRVDGSEQLRAAVRNVTAAADLLAKDANQTCDPRNRVACRTHIN